MTGRGWVHDGNVALLTDLYQLTMAASYHSQGMAESLATFDLFVREVPGERNFLVACGLEQALDYLEQLHFDDEAIAYLGTLGFLDEGFLDRLSRLRFTGEVWAMAEGEVFFSCEPVLSVTAPLIEAQIVETFLLNCITFQTMVASKAARVAIACDDRSFVDFSLRRDHGADAGLKAARAAFVGGAAATSNVLAGKTYGIPVSGTMAHSYVLAFPSELDAFRAFARDFPDRAVLLIDTFDVEEGARRAAQVASEVAAESIKIRGVRIDSGDLAPHARAVRKILDEAGLQEVQIILSGDLDEYRIRDVLNEGTPVDAFGVGTQMGTSADAPYLGGVYKLVEDETGAKMKLSTGKATLPGRKQIYRVADDDGVYERDVVALRAEPPRRGRPLLAPVMSGGRRVGASEALRDIQARCRREVARLPARLRVLDRRESFGVDLSEGLQGLVAAMRRQAN